MVQDTEHYGVSSYDKKLVRIMFIPSLLSGTLTVMVSLIFVGFVAASQFRGGSLPQQLFGASSLAPGLSIGAAHRLLASGTLLTEIINDLFLFVFWYFIGLLVYFLAIGIYSAFREAEELEHELQYVNVSRG